VTKQYTNRGRKSGFFGGRQRRHKTSIPAEAQNTDVNVEKSGDSKHEAENECASQAVNSDKQERDYTPTEHATKVAEAVIEQCSSVAENKDKNELEKKTAESTDCDAKNGEEQDDVTQVAVEVVVATNEDGDKTAECGVMVQQEQVDDIDMKDASQPEQEQEQLVVVDDDDVVEAVEQAQDDVECRDHEANNNDDEVEMSDLVLTNSQEF